MTRPLALGVCNEVSRGWGLASLMRCAEKIQLAVLAYEKKTSINVVVPGENLAHRFVRILMQNRDIYGINRTIWAQMME
jgi:hypothetical protein